MTEVTDHVTLEGALDEAADDIDVPGVDHVGGDAEHVGPLDRAADPPPGHDLQHACVDQILIVKIWPGAARRQPQAFPAEDAGGRPQACGHGGGGARRAWRPAPLRWPPRCCWQ
ncbi:MAG: hypothetical protein ACHP9Z_10735 [Streptosporangiales bacterium]